MNLTRVFQVGPDHELVVERLYVVATRLPRALVRHFSRPGHREILVW